MPKSASACQATAFTAAGTAVLTARPTSRNQVSIRALQEVLELEQKARPEAKNVEVMA